MKESTSQRIAEWAAFLSVGAVLVSLVAGLVLCVRLLWTASHGILAALFGLVAALASKAFVDWGCQMIPLKPRGTEDGGRPC